MILSNFLFFQLNYIIVDNHSCISLFYSIIGAIIVSIGLYAVMWGKSREEIEEDVGSLESLSTDIAPLLQSCRIENFENKTNGNV